MLDSDLEDRVSNPGVTFGMDHCVIYVRKKEIYTFLPSLCGAQKLGAVTCCGKTHASLGLPASSH